MERVFVLTSCVVVLWTGCGLFGGQDEGDVVIADEEMPVSGNDEIDGDLAHLDEVLDKDRAKYCDCHHQKYDCTGGPTVGLEPSQCEVEVALCYPTAFRNYYTCLSLAVMEHTDCLSFCRSRDDRLSCDREYQDAEEECYWELPQEARFALQPCKSGNSGRGRLRSREQYQGTGPFAVKSFRTNSHERLGGSPLRSL